jgi:hypothetical protein
MSTTLTEIKTEETAQQFIDGIVINLLSLKDRAEKSKNDPKDIDYFCIAKISLDLIAELSPFTNPKTQKSYQQLIDCTANLRKTQVATLSDYEIAQTAVRNVITEVLGYK